MAGVLRNIGKGLLAVGAGVLGFVGGVLGAVALGAYCIIAAPFNLISNLFGSNDKKKPVFSSLFWGIGFIAISPIAGAVAGGIFAVAVANSNMDVAKSTVNKVKSVVFGKNDESNEVPQKKEPQSNRSNSMINTNNANISNSEVVKFDSNSMNKNNNNNNARTSTLFSSSESSIDSVTLKSPHKQNDAVKYTRESGGV